METVAIIHGNIDRITRYFEELRTKDPAKKTCWSRLKLTPDGAIAWFSKGRKPQEEIIRFLGQIADLEIINPPFLTVWRNGIRYYLTSRLNDAKMS